MLKEEILTWNEYLKEVLLISTGCICYISRDLTSKLLELLLVMSFTNVNVLFLSGLVIGKTV